MPYLDLLFLSKWYCPLGVTLAALLLGFWGTSICLILVALTLGWFQGARVPFEMVTGALGFATFPLAWGWWKLKPWAYRVTFLLQAAMMFNFSALIFFSAPLSASAGTKALQFICVFPSILLSFFLNKRNVRATFRP